MTPTDLAWLAGLLEGEGCFTLHKTSGWHYPMVSLKMTDRDVVERAAYLMGAPSVFKDGKRTAALGKKPVYVAHVTSVNAYLFLLEIKPLMGERRQARIKEIIDAVNAELPYRPLFAKRIKPGTEGQCIRGHEYAITGLYGKSKGQKTCAECARESSRINQKKRYHARKAERTRSDE